jgi:acyl-coenzyme A thioesterase PaaI-like protein
MHPPSEFKPPAGFVQIPFTGVFNKALGPWFLKKTESLPIWGIQITPALIRDSQVPIAHGGVLMAFADFSMYYGARLAIERLLNPEMAPNEARASSISLKTVTISINCDFMSSVKAGEFLESHLEVGRASKGITFMKTTLKVGDRAVMQCSGTYTLRAEIPETKI